MRILFISGELIAADLAYRMKKEGHEVKLYIQDAGKKECFDNIVEKTDDWELEIDWVGKDGLIVFDDVGYGKIQDNLRKDGYNVFGGCEGGDRLEMDREYAQRVFKECGMKSIKTVDFENIASAIDYIEKHKNSWVVKQNEHISSLCFVGGNDDGSDSLNLLKSYETSLRYDFSVSLQERVYGVEVGVGRYFNGNDWIGPIEMNVEHKRFMNGDIGPLTGEMGTIMWYVEEENELFRRTLKKLEPHLKKIGFKGDIDINCMVNESEAFPLEATSRFGSPASKLQDEIHLSPWGEFLMAGAKGLPFDLKYKEGYGLAVSIVIPPFPYRVGFYDPYFKGVDVFFKNSLTEEEKKMVHFEEISRRDNNTYYSTGSEGCVLFITSCERTLQKARKKVYSLIEKIVIPHMMYRTDIGEKFLDKDIKLLRDWGWINN